MENKLLYEIALTFIPHVGDLTAKRLVAHCGGAEQVFKEKPRNLLKIPSVGGVIGGSISTSNALTRAEKELKFISKNNIKPIFYLDKQYPKRLFHCDDGPIIIYLKGTADLNNQKCVAVVGTREPSDYGKIKTEELVQNLEKHYALVISGLAYGIDAIAHRTALQNGLPTVAVVAHSLDTVYPAIHRQLADDIVNKGGVLLSEFPSGTSADKENFPKRNRIVAGMSDAVVVMESAIKGGSLITAEIANSYNRDVFALPGRVNDEKSEGCNKLIKSHRANLLESVSDLEYVLGWETNTKNKVSQLNLFEELSPNEKLIAEIIKKSGKIALDEIALEAKIPISLASTTLLNMEFIGVVKPLPGKMYCII